MHISITPEITGKKKKIAGFKKVGSFQLKIVSTVILIVPMSYIIYILPLYR